MCQDVRGNHPVFAQSQQRSRGWRIGLVLAFSGLSLLVLGQVVLLLDLRRQLADARQIAESAQISSIIAQKDADEARRLARESAHQVAEVEKKQELDLLHRIYSDGVSTDSTQRYSLPTDQMYRTLPGTPRIYKTRDR